MYILLKRRNAPIDKFPTVHYTSCGYLRARLDSTRSINFRENFSNIITSERKLDKNQQDRLFLLNSIGKVCKACSGKQST